MTAETLRSRLFAFAFLAGALTLLLDLISKWWIVDHVMAPPKVIPLTPFFNIVMVWNRGVSFGLFNSSATGQWVLIALAVVLIVVLLVWLSRAENRLVATALGLIIGGAVGNVIDRVRFGAVADFLDFYWGGWHWPAFNVADSAIAVGAALLILDSVFQRPENTDKT